MNVLKSLFSERVFNLNHYVHPSVVPGLENWFKKYF